MTGDVNGKGLCVNVTDKGNVVLSDSGNRLFLSKPELLNVGCQNCIFKLNNQCFHGLGGDDFLDEGWCKELVQFLFHLGCNADGSVGSSGQVWERYNLFTTQLQASEDYKEFKKVDEEIKQLLSGNDEGFSELSPNERKARLEVLEMKRTAAKIWWQKLTENLVKGFSKVVDREGRKENVDTVSKAISLTQIHKLASQAKQVEVDEQDD